MKGLISLDAIREVIEYANGIVIVYRDGGRDWFEGKHPDLLETLKELIVKVPDESADKHN